MNEITQTLTRLFEQHRIIFWYDAKEELQAEYEATALPDVEKLVVDNNQFGLKYRMLRQEPEQKFLLYQSGPAPAHLDNWLLDVELAYWVFRADQTGLWLNELGLGPEFTDIVATHADFFKSTPRRLALKASLKPADTRNQIWRKMVAVCAGAEPRLDNILEQLLDELAAGEDEKMRLIKRCGLDSFLWERVKQAYGYQAETPGIRDFALTLFQATYQLSLEETARLNNEALLFLKRWKDSVRFQPAFKTLSADYAAILEIEQDLIARDYRQLIDIDIFELIDRKILSGLVREVVARTLGSDTCTRLIRQRRQTIWFDQYRHLYEAIEKGAQLLQLLTQVDLTIHTFTSGIQQYSQTWFQIDQLYRQFIYHMRQSVHRTLLADLLAEIENRYTNQYLLPLNDQWQTVVDAVTNWPETAVPRQTDFYANEVAPVLRRNKKLFVIISDALRYEIGEELTSRIRQEDRYEAELDLLLTTLPSFTQLGMAALLPHETLALSSDGRTILVDGQRSAGTDSRSNLLANLEGGKGIAIQADALLNMGRDESRSLSRDHDVVYVYHNRIDATGDKRDSEERVFAAAVATLDELLLVIKKAAAANASNMIITADHGFIYQHSVLDESDFAGQQASGDKLLVTNRRFVLGHGLTEDASFKKFTAGQVGLGGDMEILLPKSINRLRKRGAGSRYVHGGATLQEIIVPLIRINKGRKSDVVKVEVDILRGSNNIITTSQITVRFYQMEPVSDKVQPRTLRVGLYTQDDQLVSDQHELVFDFSSENEREREIPVQFILTRAADAANGQEISLRLEEQVDGTSHYRPYKKSSYSLRRTFTSDFDF